MATRKFRHVLDRYGLWAMVRRTPPHDEFGPLVNLGMIQMHWRNEGGRARRFIARASRSELATFIALLAAIGQDLVPEFRAPGGSQQEAST